jgi:hypothetical protein
MLGKLGGLSIFMSLIFLSSRYVWGRVTNNYVEIILLKLILFFSSKKGASKLHVFGDSIVVIN